MIPWLMAGRSADRAANLTSDCLTTGVTDAGYGTQQARGNAPSLRARDLSTRRQHVPILEQGRWWCACGHLDTDSDLIAKVHEGRDPYAVQG